MGKLFLSVLNMSLTASYTILIVMLVRLFLKKAPKVISYALWSVVAFRLLVPFSFESLFSLIPRRSEVVPVPGGITNLQSLQTPQVNRSIDMADTVVNHPLQEMPAGSPTISMLNYAEVAAWIWMAGMAALLMYCLVSALLLKRQLRSAQSTGENWYLAENIRTPFVLGIINPRIYLPAGLDQENQKYILLHEQTHIRRKDHIIKFFAFLAVSVHWFNPFV